jgi:hypothetical protein
MPDPSEAPSKEFIDLDQATVLKEPRDLTRHLMNKAEAASYQSGQLAVENANPSRSHLKLIDDGTPPVPQPQPAPQPIPQAQPQPQVLPPAQPQQVQGPSPALVSPQAPPAPAAPVVPTDSERVQRRINRLYGQMKSAQEERDVYADRINQLEQQVNVLSQPAQTQYQLDQGAALPTGTPPAGDYVSRQELNQMFGQLTQAIQRRDALSTSQHASRAAVEQDFAQQLQDPNFRQTYETILAQDASLAADPNGPEKAALQARGMLADFSAPTGNPADAARRQALSPGVGPSVPEGAPAQPDDRVTRYNQAIARAAQTNRDEDFVRALMIKNGQL